MSAKRTILVVDDEPSLCGILKKALGRAEYRVLTATSGHQALALLKKEKIHLLLLDLKMPEMSGLEFLRKMKESKKKASIPTVILTAYGNPASAREAMALGAIDFLTKPFDLVEVITLVKEALGE